MARPLVRFGVSPLTRARSRLATETHDANSPRSIGNDRCQAASSLQRLDRAWLPPLGGGDRRARGAVVGVGRVRVVWRRRHRRRRGCDDTNVVAGDGCSDTCEVEVCWACAGEPSVCAPDDGASCDDGVFCNGADTCDGGACSVHAGDPCPGTDGDGDCSESCNEGARNCTANDPNGSACDDGHVLRRRRYLQRRELQRARGEPMPGTRRRRRLQRILQRSRRQLYGRRSERLGVYRRRVLQRPRHLQRAAAATCTPAIRVLGRTATATAANRATRPRTTAPRTIRTARAARTVSSAPVPIPARNGVLQRPHWRPVSRAGRRRQLQRVVQRGGRQLHRARSERIELRRRTLLQRHRHLQRRHVQRRIPATLSRAGRRRQLLASRATRRATTARLRIRMVRRATTASSATALDFCASGTCSAHTSDPCPGPGRRRELQRVVRRGDRQLHRRRIPTARPVTTASSATAPISAPPARAVRTRATPCPGPDGDGDCNESCNEGAHTCTATTPTARRATTGSSAPSATRAMPGTAAALRATAMPSAINAATACATRTAMSASGHRRRRYAVQRRERLHAVRHVRRQRRMHGSPGHLRLPRPVHLLQSRSRERRPAVRRGDERDASGSIPDVYSHGPQAAPALLYRRIPTARHPMRRRTRVISRTIRSNRRSASSAPGTARSRISSARWCSSIVKAGGTSSPR